jgi:hypothetical protein
MGRIVETVSIVILLFEELEDEVGAATAQECSTGGATGSSCGRRLREES